MMEVAKVTSKGQVTIPIEIRRRLKVNTGDKLVFVEDQGRIVLENSAALVFKTIQQEMQGKAQYVGVRDENDVNALVEDVRQEIWDSRYANNG